MSRIVAFSCPGWCSDALIIAHLGLREETKKKFFSEGRVANHQAELNVAALAKMYYTLS